jgi:hypothetical protein
MKKIITNSMKKIASTNKYKSWVICMLLILVAGIQSANAQTIAPTTGSTGNGTIPSGWLMLNGSTDISSQTGWSGNSLYPWLGTVGLPPTGHTTWLTGFLDEKSGTTITGLTIGNTYTFTFYTAELRASPGGPIDNSFDGVLRLSNYSTGVTLGTYSFIGASSNAWNTFTYTFTATATTLPIAFEYNVSNYNGNFWNVSIDSNAFAGPCNAGTAAPILSSSAIANVCPAATVNLTTITATNLPASTTLTWHTATPATTANKVATPSAVAAGTYYAAFFDATNNCYSGTGGNGSATTLVTATTTTCAALTANNPTTQTVPGGQVYTGNAGTELAPSGGTGPYTYSNGSSDPACINPGGGATALPPASNLTVTNSTTGAYTYTAPTAAGTYFFCIKVCDSTTPTPSCVVKTYTVVVPCAAGSNPPVLIKN